MLFKKFLSPCYADNNQSGTDYHGHSNCQNIATNSVPSSYDANGGWQKK